MFIFYSPSTINLNKKLFLNLNSCKNLQLCRCSSKKWIPQVTTLRAIKNLDSMAFEELVGILKFHEQKLAQDKRTKKRKSLAIKVQRLKCNSASKEYSFKAFVANDAFEEESDDDDFDDELSLIRFIGSPAF